ncbi:MAG: alpha/beta family hydrolase [Ilumatobacteraceae bacterium]
MLLLFPGAGSDASHSSLRAIERWVDPHPCRRLDFPYRLAGRRAPDRTPVLLDAVRRAIDDVPPDEPLVLGGRSMGGRMCSLVAAGADGRPAPPRLRGLVLVSYPLHPPKHPDRLRVEHLVSIGVPTLFISGDRDRFGSPDELARWTATMPRRAKVRHLFIEGRGHDLAGSDHTIAGAVVDLLGAVV